MAGKHAAPYDHRMDLITRLTVGMTSQGRHKRWLAYGLCLTGSELRVLVANQRAPLAEKRLECRGIE